MSKLTSKDSFFGSVTGTWMGGPLEGAGALNPREVYLDFGYPLAKSPLDAGVLPLDDATYGDPLVVDVFPPPYAQGGDVIPVSITFVNTGTTTWTTGDYGIVATFGSETWGAVPPTVVGPIAPGGSYQFVFNITAPAPVGNTYTFQYRMINLLTGVAFGQSSRGGVTVTIDPVPYKFDAAFTSMLQSAALTNPTPGGAIPLAMVPGQQIEIAVIMENTGAATMDWLKIQHFLQDIDSTGWTTSYEAFDAAGPIIPTASATFTFTITAPQVLGTYPLQFRMFDMAAGGFGEPTTMLAITIVASSCVTTNPPILTFVGSGGGTFEYRYGAAFYEDSSLASFIGSTRIAVRSNMRELNSTFKITMEVTMPNGAGYVVPYRVYSSFPTGPLSTSGTLPNGAAGVAAPAGATVIFDDNGLTAFDGSAYPTCSSGFGPPPAPPAPLPNILDGVACDGSQGGTLVGGELVFDFTDPSFPFAIDDLPTADWPRAVTAKCSGGTVTARLIGIDGAGRAMSARGTLSPDFIATTSCAWKIKKIVVEDPSPVILWVGWGDQLQLNTPYKVNDDPAVDGQDGGYLMRVYRNGVEVTRPWMLDSPNPAIMFDAVLTVPSSWEPTGKFVPGLPFTGMDRYEIVYVADNLENAYSARWKQLVDNGTIVIYKD